MLGCSNFSLTLPSSIHKVVMFSVAVAKCGECERKSASNAWLTRFPLVIGNKLVTLCQTLVITFLEYGDSFNSVHSKWQTSSSGLVSSETCSIPHDVSLCFCHSWLCTVKILLWSSAGPDPVESISKCASYLNLWLIFLTDTQNGDFHVLIPLCAGSVFFLSFFCCLLVSSLITHLKRRLCRRHVTEVGAKTCS